MLDFTGSFTLFRMTKIVFYVSPLAGLDLFASDIETCKHVSASLGSFVIPLRGMTAAFVLSNLARHSEAKTKNPVISRISK